MFFEILLETSVMFIISGKRQKDLNLTKYKSIDIHIDVKSYFNYGKLSTAHLVH